MSSYSRVYGQTHQTDKWIEALYSKAECQYRCIKLFDQVFRIRKSRYEYAKARRRAIEEKWLT